MPERSSSGAPPGRGGLTPAQIAENILQHLKAGTKDAAIRWYESSSETVGDALLAQGEREGASQLDEIAQMMVNARDYRRAAIGFERAKDWARAAQAHEQAAAWDRAAECYVRAGEKEQAAAMLAKAGDHRHAARLFLELEDYASASAALEDAGDLLGAAEIAENVGNHSRAVSLLAQVPPRDPSFTLATALLADALAELGRRDLAIQRLFAALPRDRRVRDAGAAEIAYKLAALLAAEGRAQEARSTFSMVQTFDPAFRDVRERILELSALNQATLKQIVPVVEPCLSPPGLPSVRRISSPVTADLVLPEEQLVDQMESLQLLKTLPIFEDLSLEEVKGLLQLCEPIRFLPGQVLIEEGVPGRALFFIREGVVEIVGIDGGGEVTIATLEAGTYVGEMSLIDDRPTSACVRARTKVETLRIAKPALLRYLHTHDGAALRVYRSFTRTLVERLREANAKLKSASW